ncbi:GlxA family transcriptional regulator [Zavarzinia compransoris]|uniref:GlxA family transcriptional regulator n=1 Tax=Zavarzinia compransoris TaxID=1264899 RepID=UPI0010DE8ABB|nr:helix-turn-helix domain-containing protein [Zavarzinia compransoris]TDP45606.1 transcriptional regulator GlxA family with amidase domain [Zavarzinia compransoris]
MSVSICLLVVPPATDLDVGLVLDMFRMANLFSGTEQFAVRVASLNGQAVQLTNGRSLEPTVPIVDYDTELLFVVLNLQPSKADEEDLVRIMRQTLRRKATIVAIDYAPIVLARAGLLQGRRATCHFDVLEPAREANPDVEFVEEIFVRDGRFVTCAGHLAIADMMLEIIEDKGGERLAAMLAEELLASARRGGGAAQRNADKEAAHHQDQRIEAAIRLMRLNIEMPLPLSEIAATVGLSLRQLQHLWRRYHAGTPQSYYMHLRIEHAKSLLLFSAMPVQEVALACGFSSGAVFARAFRAIAGMPARTFRLRFHNSLSPLTPLRDKAKNVAFDQ